MSLVSSSQDFPVYGNNSFLRVLWSGLAVNDVGDAFVLSNYADRSFQVVGTFGGAAIVVEGSNDGVNYSTLNDPQGNPISLSTAKIEAISELVVNIRPRVVGGDGTTALNVIALVKKAS